MAQVKVHAVLAPMMAAPPMLLSALSGDTASALHTHLGVKSVDVGLHNKFGQFSSVKQL